MGRSVQFVNPILRGGRGRVRRRRGFYLCVATLAAVLAGAARAEAQDKQDITFLGHSVTPRAGTYVATKDLNVRAEPDTMERRSRPSAKGSA